MAWPWQMCWDQKPKWPRKPRGSNRAIEFKRFLFFVETSLNIFLSDLRIWKFEIFRNIGNRRYHFVEFWSFESFTFHIPIFRNDDNWKDERECVTNIFLKNTKSKVNALARSIDLVGPNLIEQSLKIKALGKTPCCTESAGRYRLDFSKYMLLRTCAERSMWPHRLRGLHPATEVHPDY